jgi:hypothetical protein
VDKLLKFVTTLVSTPAHIHTKIPIRHLRDVVYNHREQPPHSRGRIPAQTTTLRRLGLCSGGPPEPTSESQLPRMTIRIPVMAGSRESAPTRGDPALVPPDNTRQVGSGPVGTPKVDDGEPSNTEPGQVRGARSGENGKTFQVDPVDDNEWGGGSNELDIGQGTVSTVLGINQQVKPNESVVVTSHNQYGLHWTPRLLGSFGGWPWNNREFGRKLETCVKRRLRYAS